MFTKIIHLCFKKVQRAVELLSKAKKPVILVGSQATLPPMPAEKLKEALEVFKAIIFCKLKFSEYFFFMNTELERSMFSWWNVKRSFGKEQSIANETLQKRCS